ncbi:hypothetical protein ACLOJK_009627 [Asimina triloba]
MAEQHESADQVEGRGHEESQNPVVVQEFEENAATMGLKPLEKRALFQLKAKLQEAIANGSLFADPREEKAQVWACPQVMSIWGVPLLPSKSKNHVGTDIVLLKFLKARDFKAGDAFEMLRKTLIWRKEARIDGIVEEELGPGFESVGFMNGSDKGGHPVCYNIYAALKDKDRDSKLLESEEKREAFVRWRVQLMEGCVRDLNLKAGGIGSIVQISDLKNSPGPPTKELRITLRKAVSVLEDHYPDFVEKNIFINVPFRHYAYNAMISRFLNQRSGSKCIFVRPSKVQETLLK